MIEVTAGGPVEEPTYTFSGSDSAPWANLTADQSGNVIASSTVVADDFQLRDGTTFSGFVAAQQALIESLNQSLLALTQTVREQDAKIAMTSVRYTVTTIAGSGASGSSDGPGSQASFAYPMDLCHTSDYTGLYIADTSGNKLRRMDVTWPFTVTTVATLAHTPWGVAASRDGLYVYVSSQAGKIIKITLASGSQTELAQVGGRGLVLTSDDSTLFLADVSANLVRRVDTTTGTVHSTTFSCTFPVDVTLSADETVAYVACGNGGSATAFTVSSGAQRSSTVITFNPHGIALSQDGSTLYIADWGDCEIHTVAMSGADVTNTRATVAGLVSGYTGTNQNGAGQASGACTTVADGIGNDARLGRLNGALLSADGRLLYFTDAHAKAVRVLTL